MYAIVMSESAPSYCSAVFGVVPGEKPGDTWSRQYVVFDREKKRLILHAAYLPRVMPRLVQQILITDNDQSDWELDRNGYGASRLIHLNDGGWASTELTDEELRQCLAYDARNPYREWQPIESERDIDNFMEVSFGLHDAYIQSVQQEGDAVCVLFSSCWGCDIEITLTGDIAYQVDGEIPDFNDWWTSSILFSNGFVYLIEDEHDTVWKDLSGLTWFKGRKMAYHLIPKMEKI